MTAADGAAYTGSTLLSPLFGVLAQNITMKLYPFVLLLMLVLMTFFSEQLHRKTAAKRAGNALKAESPFDKGDFFIFPPL